MSARGTHFEHLTLAPGATRAGLPCMPISIACSRVSQDLGKRRHTLTTTAPGLVFARDASCAHALAQCQRVPQRGAALAFPADA